MPKIVIGISSSFCAGFIRGQVGFLVEKGWDVVIISGPGEEIKMLALAEHAQLHTLNFTKSILPFSDLVCLWRIINILKLEKPDLINAGNPKSGFLIMLACWLLNYQRRIFTLHGLVSDSRAGLKKYIIRVTEKLTCSIAKKIIVVSESLRQHAVEEKILLQDKSLVIENGSCNGLNSKVFEKNAHTIDAAQKLRAKLKLTGDEYILGFVGRLSKDKGIDLLFEAFNLLRKKYLNVKLLVAGPLENANPFSKRYTQQLFEDKDIFYLGKIADVAPVYLLMKMLVLSSFREGFGNVLIEAAAMEVPVIAPDIPGCRNALLPGFNGLLFRKGDTAEMIIAIEKYMNNEQLRELHGNNGSLFVTRNFSQEKIWNGLLTAYNDLLLK
jgi:glycosyltransferase involved in cell wall biosynthesis